MEKTDLIKTDKQYYTASRTPELAGFPQKRYLSILGKGDPSGSDFAQTISTLYSEAYRIKFASKAKGGDFVVPKLEGLWWYDEEKYKNVPMDETTLKIPRSEWSHRLMIRLPDFVDEEITATIASPVALFSLHEQQCVQMLHIGSYNSEPASLLLLKQFSDQHSLVRAGLHHEIYLTDYRKTAPERLRTILREPVKKQEHGKH